MPVKVKINIDPNKKILLKRNLNKNGKAQKLFTNEVKRLSDPYVPFDTGELKRNVDVTTNQIIYKSPYAKKQYYKNKGRGLRGKQWVSRMWADRGNEIVDTITKFVGGKRK